VGVEPESFVGIDVGLHGRPVKNVTRYFMQMPCQY